MPPSLTIGKYRQEDSTDDQQKSHFREILDSTVYSFVGLCFQLCPAAALGGWSYFFKQLQVFSKNLVQL